MINADTDSIGRADMILRSIPGFDYAGALGRLSGNREVYFELLKMFFTSTYVFEIREAMEEHDEARARFNAHALKGSSLNMGFNRIAELSDLFGTLLKSRQTAFARDCLNELEKDFQNAREAALNAIQIK